MTFWKFYVGLDWVPLSIHWRAEIRGLGIFSLSLSLHLLCLFTVGKKWSPATPLYPPTSVIPVQWFAARVCWGRPKERHLYPPMLARTKAQGLGTGGGGGGQPWTAASPSLTHQQGWVMRSMQKQLEGTFPGKHKQTGNGPTLCYTLQIHWVNCQETWHDLSEAVSVARRAGCPALFVSLLPLRLQATRNNSSGSKSVLL